MKNKKYYTIKETQKLTGLSRQTIMRYLDKGIFTGKQAGKQTKWHIEYLSIPTFLREEDE